MSIIDSFYFLLPPIAARFGCLSNDTNENKRKSLIPVNLFNHVSAETAMCFNNSTAAFVRNPTYKFYFLAVFEFSFLVMTTIDHYPLYIHKDLE